MLLEAIQLGSVRCKLSAIWQHLSPTKAALFKPFETLIFPMKRQQGISGSSVVTYKPMELHIEGQVLSQGRTSLKPLTAPNKIALGAAVVS